MHSDKLYWFPRLNHTTACKVVKTWAKYVFRNNEAQERSDVRCLSEFGLMLWLLQMIFATTALLAWIFTILKKWTESMEDLHPELNDDDERYDDSRWRANARF